MDLYWIWLRERREEGGTSFDGNGKRGEEAGRHVGKQSVAAARTAGGATGVLLVCTVQGRYTVGGPDSATWRVGEATGHGGRGQWAARRLAGLALAAGGEGEDRSCRWLAGALQKQER